MAMNRVQFQKGLSLTEFTARYGTEAACRAAVERTRWPHGFCCPRCQHGTCRRFERAGQIELECTACPNKSEVPSAQERSLGQRRAREHQALAVRPVPLDAEAEVRPALFGRSQVAFQLAFRAQATAEANCGLAGVRAACGAATSEGDALCVLRIGSIQVPACKD
jgi:hypothetical protein